ncbi:hypothetical protein [uncultured Aliiroseovarius sp.]|uniref:hypothetical protein n=1 Tax=uncultured Aliiroseovarius sp. TaxID=1658783 RepID=UPI002593F855|nr:hypothetical protein [uncultured Aliiroseovarius sp.]
MPNSAITDETLMAYADGMLPDDEAAKVDAAVANDPALAARVAMFGETATRLSDLSQAQKANVPAGLEDHIRALAAETAPEPVIDLAAHRKARQVPFWQIPVAASLFLAVGVAGTLLLQQGQTNHPLHVTGLEQPALHKALDDLPSGESRDIAGGGEVVAVASFTNAEGEFCREIEFRPAKGRTIISVACHEDTSWTVRLAVAAATADDTGYAPASSLETLDAYLSASQASAPMSVADEAAALRKLTQAD